MVPGTSRVPFDEEEQVGLSRGKNAGIRMARAPLLLFTDDDVVVPPGWIRSYAEFFSRHPLDTIVAGGPIIRSQLRTWVHGLLARQPCPHRFAGNGSWGSGAATARLCVRRQHGRAGHRVLAARRVERGSGEHADGSIDVRRYGAAGQSLGGRGKRMVLPRHSDPAPGSSGQLLTGTHPPERFRARSQRLLEGRAHEHRGSLRCPGSVSFADSPHWCGTFSRRVSSWHGSGLAAERLRWSGRDRRRGGPADPTRRCGRGGTEHDFTAGSAE